MELKLLEKVDANPCGESRESFKAPTLLRSERQDPGERHSGKPIPGAALLLVSGEMHTVQQS